MKAAEGTMEITQRHQGWLSLEDTIDRGVKRKKFPELKDGIHSEHTCHFLC